MYLRAQLILITRITRQGPILLRQMLKTVLKPQPEQTVHATTISYSLLLLLQLFAQLNISAQSGHITGQKCKKSKSFHVSVAFLRLDRSSEVTAHKCITFHFPLK